MKILKKREWLNKSKTCCKTKEHWHKQEKLNFVVSIDIVGTPLRLQSWGLSFQNFPKKGEGLVKYGAGVFLK